MRYEETIQIDADSHTVWAGLADIARWKAQRVPVATLAEHTVESRQDGTSTATLVFQQSGVLAPLMTLLSKGMTRRYLRMEAQGLKRRCEQAAAG